MAEIERTVNFVKEKQVEFSLLHCNSTYPSPVELLNLSLIPSFTEKNLMFLLATVGMKLLYSHL